MFESVIEGYLKEFAERPAKIEEAQNKNSRTEDEERRNEEEKAKAAFERNKEFEAFIESFKEKMDIMQKALRKTQVVDDYFTTMGGITKEPALQFPPKFTIPEVDRQKEKDQVNIVMKGLLPVYYNRMFASPIMDFEQLCNSGMRIDNAIDNGQLDKREGRISVAPKKVFGSSSKASNIQANINAIEEARHLMRGGGHFKPTYLEEDYPGRDPPPAREADKAKAPKESEKDKVLAQLKKTQASISIWGLIMASQKHRDAILEALARKEVPMDTTPEQVLSIMGMTIEESAIIFTTKDLPPEGGDHNRAFYVTIDCIGSKVPKVLEDNGSLINVYSMCALPLLTPKNFLSLHMRCA
uniref:Uncharacterized protein n=1 Tax=Fagus sylvatica TaxID=28930 RepID=A0A2N9IKX1_FAGSY